MIASTVSLRIRIVPPSPMIWSRSPCRPSKKARVTTNDGIPTRETRKPFTSPINAPVPRHTRTPTHHGQSWRVVATPSIAAATPAV